MKLLDDEEDDVDDDDEFFLDGPFTAPLIAAGWS